MSAGFARVPHHDVGRIPLRRASGSAAKTLVLAILSAAAVWAADAKSLIRTAYEKTSRAATIEDYGSIIQLCHQALDAGPDESQTAYINSLLSWSHNRRGEVYTEQASEAQRRSAAQQAAELDGRALADFELAIKLDGSRWKPWHNRGVSRAIAGKYSEAVADFTRVIELNPAYTNAWFNRGELKFDLGKFDEALRDYTEAIRLTPNDAGAFTSRAHTYFRLGRFAEALRDYSEAIRLTPQDAHAHANRGDAYQSLGRWQEARDDLTRAIQLAEDSPRVLQSAAWLMATCPDSAIRDAKLAVQAAERAVELSAEPDALLLDTLAAAYANAGRFTEAVAKIQESIRIAPAQESAALQKRLVLYQQQLPYRQAQAASAATAPKSVKAR
jgi:tetratricopeptide (TPR) repeat protein